MNCLRIFRNPKLLKTLYLQEAIECDITESQQYVNQTVSRGQHQQPNNTQESQGEHLTLSQLEERVLNVEKNISFEGKKKSKVNEIMKVEYRYLST